MKDLLVVFLCVLSGAAAHHEVHLVPAHIICPGVTGAHDILIPDPHDCSVYYKCKNDQAIPQTCPPGLHWCQTLIECVLPALANCTIGHKIVTYSPNELATYHPITPKPKEPSDNENICPNDNILLPHPLNCDLYYRCKNGTPEIERCPKGTGYSCWNGDCVDSTIANCLSKPQDHRTCAVNGKRLMYPEDCRKYYECNNNKVTIKKCPHNSEYNQWFMDCYDSKKAHCQAYEITTTITTDSPGTTVSPSPVQNLCPKVNATIPDPTDCNKYLKCDANHIPHEHQCPDNLKYSCWNKECEASVIAKCSSIDINVGQPCQNNFQKISVPGKCNAYYVCEHNVICKKTCKGNLEWNPWFERCVHSDLSHCSTHLITSTSTITPAYTPTPSQFDNICPTLYAQYPDELNCTNYYVCINGTPKLYPCDGDKIYSCWDQKCLPPQTANCINGVNQEGQACGTNGDTQPNPNNCRSYFECENGTAKSKSCEHNLSYNKYYKKCVPTNESHCKEAVLTTPIQTSETSSTETSMNPSDATTKHQGAETTTKSDTSGNSSGPTVSIPIEISTTPKETQVSSNDTTPEPPGTETTTKSDTSGNSSGPTVSIPIEISTTPKETQVSSNDTTLEPPRTETTTKSDTSGNSGGPTVSIPIEISTTPKETQVSSNDTTPEPPGTETTTKSDTSGNSRGPTVSIPIEISTTPKETQVSSNDTTPEPPRTETTTKSDTTGNSSGPTVSIPIEISTTPKETQVSSNDTTPEPPGTETTTKSDTSGNSSGPTVSIPIEISTTPKETQVSSNDTTPEPPRTETTTKSDTSGNSNGPTVSIPIVISTTPKETQVSSNDTTPEPPGTETTTKSDTSGNSSGPTVSIPIEISTTPKETQVSSNDTTLEPPRTETTTKSDTSGNSGGPTVSIPIEISTTPKETQVSSNDTTPEPPGTETTTKSDTSGNSGGPTVSIPIEISTTPKETQVSSNDTTPEPPGTETTTKSDTSGNSSGPTVSIPIEISTTPKETQVSSNDTTPETPGTETTTKLYTSTNPNTTITPGPDDICPFDGAQLPNEEDCNSYYVCKNGKPESQKCPDNQEYSCWDQKCEPAGSATCIKQPGQVGHSCNIEGIKMPNVANCGSYLMCVGQKVEIRLCAFGTAYNKWFKSCVHINISHCKTHATIPPPRTTTEKGSPNTPNTTITPGPDDICPFDGAQLPNEEDCNSYYVCKNGKPESQKCPDNQEYSCWDQKCEPAGSATCIKQPGQVGHSCNTEGIKMPNVANCGSYLMCVGRKVEIRLCAFGTAYNKWFKSCVHINISHCKTHATIPPPRTTTENGSPNTPNTTITPGPDDICPFDGAQLPNEEDCNSYYVCKNGKPESQKCPDNQEYSCWDQKCEPAGSATCIKQPGQVGHSCNTEGIKMPNVANCGSYLMCVGRKVEIRLCAFGTAYNKWFKSCVHINISHCKTHATIPPPRTTTENGSPNTPNTTITPGPDDICPFDGAQLPNEEDCNSYYVCKNGKPESQKCPDNQEYSCWDQKCEPAGSATCIKQPGQVGHSCNTEGIKMPNVANCGSYLMCVGRKVEIRLCAFGTAYNKWFKSCVHINISHCKTHATIPPPRTTTENGSPNTPNTTITPGPDDICPFDGAQLPNEEDCNSYYVCKNGKPESQKCPDNQEYSCWDQKCEPAGSATCIKQPGQVGHSCNTEGIKMPNVANCGSYLMCVGRKVEIRLCAFGTAYNKWFKSCVHINISHCKTHATIPPPRTTTEKGSPNTPNTTITPGPDDICPFDGAQLPNEEDCNSYYVCKNGKPESQKCPDNQEYSCWDQKCEPAGSATCIKQPGQVGHSCNTEGIKMPNVANCGSYLMCVGRKVEIRLCAFGTAYNKWFKSCVHINISHCKTHATIPPPRTTTENGSPNTPNTTITPGPDDICPFDGAQLPNEEDCNSYYVCKNGKPESQKCPDNQEYSCWDQKCEPAGSATCIKQPGQVGHSCNTEGIKMPNVANCGSYLMCVGRKVEIRLCAFGTAYNKWFKSCVHINISHCKTHATIPPPRTTTEKGSPTTPNTTITPGIDSPCTADSKDLPDINDCRKFFKCINGKYRPQTCRANLVWNYFTQSCAHSCFKPVCSKDPNAHKYPQSSNCLLLGVQLPNPFTCDKYFICIGFQIIEKQCPSSQRYDWWKGNCVIATTGKCAAATTGNSGSSGTTVESPTTPNTTITPGIDSPCTADSKDLPDINDCRKFFKCINGKYRPQTCRANLVWNYFTQSCAHSCFKPVCSKDPNAHKYPQSSNCLLLGVQLPNPFTCDKYFICIGFQIIEKQCPSSQRYDWWKGNCVIATTGKCAAATTGNSGSSGTTVESPTTPNTTITPGIDSPCTADSKDLPDINDCRKFFKCINGKYRPQTCRANLVWNYFTQSCAHSCFKPVCSKDPNAHKYPQSSNCLLLGVQLPNPFTCDKYFICIGFQIIEKQCPSSQRYDWWKGNCVIATTGKCAAATTGNSGSSGTTVESPVTSTNSDGSINLPDVDNCRMYNKYINGKKEHKRCPDNKLWNCFTQSCYGSVYAPCCSNDPNATHYAQYSYCGLVGKKIPNPLICDKYFKCSFFRITQETCPSGNIFDWVKASCVNANTGKCVPTVLTTNTPGTATHVLSTTTVIGEPAGGSSSTTETADQTTGESTGSSSTSSSTKADSTSTSAGPTTRAPTTGATSSTKKPSPLCPDTIKLIRYPAPDDCYGYFECVDRQLVKKKCPAGQNYNCRTKMCEPITNPIHCCSTPTTTTTRHPMIIL